MAFKDAVKRVSGLESAYQAGLQALRAEDRPHIHPEDPRHLRGSVDVDTALLEYYPNANRWDFAVAYKHADRTDEVVYWIELHTASDSQVKVVIKKAKWLLDWLKGTGKPLADFERDIIWVSSGSTSFTLSAPQKKQMAQAGLKHCGTVLRISEKRGR